MAELTCHELDARDLIRDTNEKLWRLIGEYPASTDAGALLRIRVIASQFVADQLELDAYGASLDDERRQQSAANLVTLMHGAEAEIAAARRRRPWMAAAVVDDDGVELHATECLVFGVDGTCTCGRPFRRREGR